MKTFNSVREAFQYFIDEVWKELDLKRLSEEEKKQLENAKRDFRYKTISDKRMTAILNTYGKVTVITQVAFEKNKKWIKSTKK